MTTGLTEKTVTTKLDANNYRVVSSDQYQLIAQMLEDPNQREQVLVYSYFLGIEAAYPLSTILTTVASVTAEGITGRSPDGETVVVSIGSCTLKFLRISRKGVDSKIPEAAPLCLMIPKNIR